VTRFLQSGHVEKCKMGITLECVTLWASQTDEVNAVNAPIGVPSLLAETLTRLGPDVRGHSFLRFGVVCSVAIWK
jgi:hypothetical protein